MIGQIVVLNGTPRSGKSSIVSVMQEEFAGVWMNLGIDKLKKATPARFQPGIGLRPGGERPDLEPLVKTLYLALYESVAAHSRRGVNVVVDATHHDFYSQPLGILPACARVLRGFPVVFVGVRCPVEVTMSRLIATWGFSYDSDGSIPAPVRRWHEAVHDGHSYDLNVDTSQSSSRDCADLIAQRLTAGVPATAFSRLADSEDPSPFGRRDQEVR